MKNQTGLERIYAELNEAFAPLDQSILERKLAWADQKCEAVCSLRAQWPHKANMLDREKRLSEAVAAAGGAQWYRLFTEHDRAGVHAVITKRYAATVASRNSRIAIKLGKAGITAVTSSEFQFSPDGFNGWFAIETDAGRKNVKIETIFAGGHNIQILHLRVLINIK